MAHTILVRNTNDCTTTVREAIMQREKLVNKLHIVVPQLYNDFEMKDFDLLMTFKLPISKELHVEVLKLADESYKDTHLLYEMPINTRLTAENGDVEFQLKFVRSYLEPETGENIQQVREIAPSRIHICEIADWMVVSDSAMSELAAIYLNTYNLAKALEVKAEEMSQDKVDDITISDGTLHLTSKGDKVGDGVDLEELGDEIVENNNDGMVRIIGI